MHLLVLNRGLFLVDRVDVDGLLIEGVFTRYDMAEGHYVRTPADRQRELSDVLLAFRERTGGAALVIDYADRDTEAEYARTSAAALGLPIFVGRVELGAPTGRGQ